MLIQFSVKNYKVFKEEQVFSMLAHKAYKEHGETHVSTVKSFDLLHSAVLYGANASGKSLFFEALGFIRNFILNSSKESSVQDLIETEAFLLDTATVAAPSEFELIFLHNDKRYRYGFVVNTKEVLEEWLYVKDEREVEYFYRSDGSYDYNNAQVGVIKLLTEQGLVRDNALLLSVMAQFNDKTAKEIYGWVEALNVISGLNSHIYHYYTVNKAKEDPSFKKRLLYLLQAADVGIVDFDMPHVSWPEELNELKGSLLETVMTREANKTVKTYRYQYDEYNRPMEELVSFDFEEEESAGTQKYFSLLGPILYTIETGSVLCVDELDARLHPNLVEAIVNLFHQEETNPHHAQLIFATHNTNLLKKSIFRRDQLWFVDKNSYNASKIYSFINIKSDDGTPLKAQRSYEEKYLRGQYGAVPSLWRFQIEKNDFLGEYPAPK